MEPKLYDRVDLRVRDARLARRFYDPLMEALGLVFREQGQRFTTYAYAPGTAPFFGFTEDAEHVTNGTRIAFAAASRALVDRVAVVARSWGQGLEPSYDAVFFEDPDGNCLEVVCHADGV